MGHLAPPSIGLPSGVLSGGEGGGLYSEKEGGKEVPLSLPPSRTAGDVTVQETLLALGVYTLARSQREALAARLVGLGIGSADLLALSGYLSSCMSDAAQARRVVVAKVIDTATLPQALEDLRRHLELTRGRAVPGRSTEHYWGFPSPHPSCACEGCEARRRAGHAEVRA